LTNRDEDLLPGAIINVYGRAVVISDCDAFTRDYYKSKFGVENFTKPQIPEEPRRMERQGHVLPPWNGFGSYEDSEGNCISVIPKLRHIDTAKKLVKAR